jgi:hypothetical protein
MKKALGKWLMDIAKYVATAIILTSVFGDIESTWLLYIIASAFVIIVLSSGLFLLKEEKKKGE